MWVSVLVVAAIATWGLTWASPPPDQIEEILAAIKKSGGVVDLDQPTDPWINISFEEAKAPGGFKPTTPLPASFEPGLRTLSRLDDRFSISLSLEGSGITDASLAHIEGLTGIRELMITETAITDAGLARLKGLKRLGKLGAYSNKITGVGFRDLKGLSGLRDLTLHEEMITDEGIAGVGQLSGLRSLELGGTEVTDVGLAHLQGLNELRVLTLIQNQVHGPGLKSLKQMRQLSTLYITEDLTDEGLACLGELRGLHSLFMAYSSGISDAALVHFRDLKDLTKLVISEVGDEQIGDDGMAHLGALSHLRELELYGGRFTDVGLAHLASLKDLQRLRLHNTAATGRGAIMLREAVKQLSVELIYE